ncbi:hypothetical protein MTR62_07645 [Novosphingobium sp. 1949]|uniref:Iron transporter n=1 Tax=Novosphingobium organovorum TaxID=2930092 RepID=A0ABT0BCN8_9SPHN|nr:hypothetical protein [Novosphingobium organovorum]MCJ2182564.1 hypothetical protein [Novosphingobium organovorum]
MAHSRPRARPGGSALWLRFHVPLRILAATLGNYALSALATAWLARVLALGLHPAEASALATILSFALFAALVIVIFAAQRPARLCLMLVLCGGALALLLGLGLPGAGGPL